jgi:hypothetical protein
VTSRVTPRAADRIRKGAAVLLATALTLLLLRVLARVARGRETWSDPELWGLVALAALAVAWVRKARRWKADRPGGPEERV